ncbi:Apoptosis facilitator Bcl-2-like protein 14, partial [Varanus komodoensis]
MATRRMTVTDEEAKIIDTIVALLRKSGDELQDKMQKDKTFSQCISDLLSYAFFRKVADQFLEEVTVNLAANHEVQDQSTKVAFAMELTARLTNMDRHPMNIVLGFGTKYLKEKFSPWISSQGGWDRRNTLHNWLTTAVSGLCEYTDDHLKNEIQ